MNYRKLKAPRTPPSQRHRSTTPDPVLYRQPDCVYSKYGGRIRQSINLQRRDRLCDRSEKSISLPQRNRSRYGPKDVTGHPYNYAHFPALPPDVELSVVSSFIPEHMKACDTAHLKCRSLRNVPGPMPSRLIYIGPSYDTSSIHLVDTNGDFFPYAALSYCWGSSGSNYTTTIDKLKGHKEHIPWKRLPRAIQDTILVTWGLGLHYLWVDALCIIQRAVLEHDHFQSIHTGDWDVEAEKMPFIYQSAQITIVAALASDCRDTFLGYLHFSSQHEVRRQGGGFADHWSPDPEPTDTRAWCFQETVLSRRTVKFLKGEVQWACEECDAQLCRDMELYLKDKISRSWYDLVKDFSSRKVTYVTDRLAALSGVIKHFGKENNLTPVLGLWKEQLAQGLVWSPKNSLTSPRRIDNPEFPMPSWTWLGMKGAIRAECDPGKSSLVTKVQPAIEFDFQCQWDGPELVGRLLQVDLELRGVTELVRITQTESEGRVCSWVDIKDMPSLQEYPDFRIDTEDDLADLLQPGVTATFLQTYLRHKKVIRKTQSPIPPEILSKATYFERLRLQEEYTEETTTIDTYRCGILLRLVDHDSQTYRRVGVAFFLDKPDGESQVFRGPPQTIRLQ